MTSSINIFIILYELFCVCVVMVMGRIIACMPLSCRYDQHDVPWLHQHEQYLQNRADSVWERGVSWLAGSQYQDRHGPLGDALCDTQYALDALR